jgi:hypothetical protein
LLSVGCIADKGNVVVFKKKRCEIYNQSNQLVASGTKEGGLFKLDKFDHKSMMALNSGRKAGGVKRNLSGDKKARFDRQAWFR